MPIPKNDKIICYYRYINLTHFKTLNKLRIIFFKNVLCFLCYEHFCGFVQQKKCRGGIFKYNKDIFHLEFCFRLPMCRHERKFLVPYKLLYIIQ